MLDDSVVDEFRAIPGVTEVFPKMKFTFPTRGYGGKRLFGRNLWAEIIADGISPELVKGDLSKPEEFIDRDVSLTCTETAQCPDGQSCGNGQCTKNACRYSEKTRLSACPGESYCAKDTKKCELPIPFVVSHHLLELYNGSLSTAMSGAKGRSKMPKLSKNTVLGFQLNVTLGRSFLGRAKRAKPITRRIKLVGFSNKATVGTPNACIRKAFQFRFSGSEAANLSPVVAWVGDQTAVPSVVKAVKEAGLTWL